MLVAVDCLRAPNRRFGGDSGLRQELANSGHPRVLRLSLATTGVKTHCRRWAEPEADAESDGSGRSGLGNQGPPDAQCHLQVAVQDNTDGDSTTDEMFNPLCRWRDRLNAPLAPGPTILQGARFVAPPRADGWALTFAPRSFSNRRNSGDASIIVPAAARKRSTASGGRTKDVGC